MEGERYLRHFKSYEERQLLREIGAAENLRKLEQLSDRVTHFVEHNGESGVTREAIHHLVSESGVQSFLGKLIGRVIDSMSDIKQGKKKSLEEVKADVAAN